MTEPKKSSPDTGAAGPLMDLDSFVTTDEVSAVWVNGLMVWLMAGRGGVVARPLAEWRQVLAEYQALR